MAVSIVGSIENGFTVTATASSQGYNGTPMVMPPAPATVVTVGAPSGGNDLATLSSAFNVSNRTVELQAGATYIVGSSGTNPRINVSGRTGLRIKGNGATIRAANNASGGGGSQVLRIFNCEDVVIDGLTVDGNKANRANGGQAHGLEIANSDNVAILSCNLINAPMDNLILSATDTQGVDPTTHCNDTLVWDCLIDNGYRQAITVRNAHNFFILDNDLTNTGRTEGADPSDAIDIEPNANTSDSSPNNSNYYIAGNIMTGNRGTNGVSLAPHEGDIANGTIEGNYMADGSPTASNQNKQNGGSALRLTGQNIWVYGNLIENFDTALNGRTPRSLIDFPNTDCQNILVEDNYANNISLTEHPLIPASIQPIGPINIFYVASGTTGIVIRNNHRFNHSGFTGQTNYYGGNGVPSATITGNTTDGSAGSPTPTPPIEIPFGDPGSQDVPEYEAIVGAVVEPAALPTVTQVTVPVTLVAGSNRGLLIDISAGCEGLTAPNVASVVYAGSEAAGFEERRQTGAGGNISFVETWSLLAPAASAGNLVVTFDLPVRAARVTVHQYNGVNSFGATGEASGNAASNPINVSVITTRQNSIVHANVTRLRGTADTAFTPDASDTELTEGVTGTDTTFDYVFTDLQTEALEIGTATITTTMGFARAWVAVGVEVRGPEPDINLTLQGFERTREFGTATISITDPPQVGLPLVGFERERELGDLTLLIEEIEPDPEPEPEPVPTVASAIRLTTNLAKGVAIIGALGGRRMFQDRTDEIWIVPSENVIANLARNGVAFENLTVVVSAAGE